MAICPVLDEIQAIGPDDLEPLTGDRLNHPSFEEAYGDDPEAAGLGLVRQAVAQGFAEILADRSTAEAALGGQVYPAPLGTVSKTRDDGTWKHRLIQDLRFNCVNRTVRLPERLVLPRPLELGKDLAELAADLPEDAILQVGIVDFADAFMSISLGLAERRFNCAELPEPLSLGRPPLHPEEPASGRFVSWRVLGFGGRPNPLVFGRVTSSVMRAAQSILTSAAEFGRSGRKPVGPSRGSSPSSRPSGREPVDRDWRECDFLDASVRMHLYVDDAAVAIAGTPDEIVEAFDLLLLFLLVLGAPIAWSKVALHPIFAADPVRWIGVDFDLVASGAARLRLPPAFVKELLEQVEAAAGREGRISDADAHSLVGRATRVSYVVPAAAPFAAALRTALSEARATAATCRRRAQRGSHSTQRFATAAGWFLALLRDQPIDGVARLPLGRLVLASGPPRLAPGACEALVFDASPWGGGVIRFSGRKPVEIMVLKWTREVCRDLKVVRGESAFLPFWEALTALAALVVWCGPGGLSSIALVGDNLGALTAAVSTRGRGDVARICREVALRQARLGLHIAVGHLPSQLNDWADALSRVFAPKRPQMPQELLHLPLLAQPSTSDLFSLQSDVV